MHSGTVPLSSLENEDADKIQGNWWSPVNYKLYVRKAVKAIGHGSQVDIHAMQTGTGKEAERQKKMWEHSQQYANETEHLYSFLQVMTACVNSFAHGSNDVANAIGPFAAIYYVWRNGTVTPANTPTDTWMLAFGAAMLVIGLATYGYNIMAVLGNKLTLMSPSRGVCMETGAAITVLLASQYGIPVSSTMCIVGATTGVGLVSGGFGNVNWRTFGWILLGWVLTVPLVGTLSGCLMAIILYAPKW
jgi:sodium-dependent phosphate transporter